ncbi:lysylphosphatidylglycerol synthase transmembrane domain-containing protein [Methanolobus sp. ZRKC2]|uniref:lysylphosphatidylglycerol synthase transmembrane domain-containing protein n=1 Tax=Methanolobus sp. ZRKC2 TaxID=3125783 RepID=UPI00324784BE
MNEKMVFMLKLAIGLTLISFIFSMIEWNEFMRTISEINLIFIAITVVLFFFPSMWLSVLKWSELLSVHKIHLPFNDLYAYYLISTFFNNFLPSTVGGDVSRVVYLKKMTNKTAAVAASVIMERLTGLVGLVFFCFFSVMLDPFLIQQLNVSYSDFLLMLLLVCLGFIAAFYSFSKIKKNDAYFHKHKLLASIQSKVVSAFDTVYFYRKHKKTLLLTLVMSVVFISFGIICNYLYFLSIGVKVPFLALVQIYTIVRLVGLLPISINSLGVTEGLYVLLFSMIGISSVDALTVALLGRVLLMLVSLSGGLLFIVKGKSVDRRGMYDNNN